MGAPRLALRQRRMPVVGYESRSALRFVISTLSGSWIRLHTHSSRGRDRSAGRIKEESARRAERNRGKNRGPPEDAEEGKRLGRTPSRDFSAGRPLSATRGLSESREDYQSHNLEKVEMRYIGKPIPEYDSFLKITGTATYAFDIELPCMLHAKLVTSHHAHAKVVKIDTSKAEKMPGVVAVATGAEFPYRLGIYVGDRDVLAVDKVRWVGHPVAAVIAETLEAAERAIDQVEVDYEPLPTVFDPIEALKPGAPIVHEKLADYRVSPAFKPVPGTNIANQFRLVKGDAEKGLQESDVVVEGEFGIPHVSHGFMELQSIVAHYKKDGTIEI